MARVAPGVVRHGTAKNLAGHDGGYSASGESQFSRQSAHSANVKTRGYVENHPAKVSGPRSHGELIAENERALAKIRAQLATENNPARLVKLKRDLEIKSAFVARLRSEAR
jgi:hypothetical protein